MNPSENPSGAIRGVLADWASTAQAHLRGETDLLSTWWTLLEQDRASYHAACSIPTHPMAVLNSFFSQLSAPERHGQTPIDPSWIATFDFELFAAMSQIARAQSGALDASCARTRFLYVTDLHGDSRAYEALPDLCDEHNIQVLVHGGDMLPKGGDMLAAQRAFLAHSLPECLDRCIARGIAFLGLFGNDDLRGVYGQWTDLARSRRGVYDLAHRWYTLPGGVTIRGCSWVPDYPFGLKDWCLRDSEDASPVPTRGRSIVTSADGVAEIDDPAAFFASRPTLEEHLDSLVGLTDSMQRAVLVSHAPPADLGLGRLWNGEDVGSKSVHRWILRHQPLLTLSGHIHESTDVGRAWSGSPHHTAKLGRTTCHQPGQVLPDRLSMSIIEIDSTNGTPVVTVEWSQRSL